MDRQEFMQDLRESLEGEISPSAVQDNLRYYNNYFDEQKAAGRSDEEILEELGEARLIARTILQSVEAGVDASPEGYDSDPSDNGGRDGGYRHDYTQAEQSTGRDSYSGAGDSLYRFQQMVCARGRHGRFCPGARTYFRADGRYFRAAHPVCRADPPVPAYLLICKEAVGLPRPRKKPDFGHFDKFYNSFIDNVYKNGYNVV